MRLASEIALVRGRFVGQLAPASVPVLTVFNQMVSIDSRLSKCSNMHHSPTTVPSQSVLLVQRGGAKDHRSRLA